MKSKTENYRFFQHAKCEYFPCHAVESIEDFNCLFCYCPLYALGEKCGGNFSYNAKGYKVCTLCDFPHRRANYEKVLARFDEIARLARQSGAAKPAAPLDSQSAKKGK